MSDTAILTAEELAYLKAKPLDQLDGLDIGVLFDHIDLQRAELIGVLSVINRMHAAMRVARNQFGVCACVYCERFRGLSA